MAVRYDVCRIRQPGKAFALAVVLQHGILDELRTVIVAPLMRLGKAPRIKRLHPNVSVEGIEYFIAIDLFVAIDRKQITNVVASVDRLADDIALALDLVFIGF